MPATTPSCLLPIASALVLLVLASGVLTADEPLKTSAHADGVRDLLQERLTVLTEIVKLQRMGFQRGEVQFDSVLASEAEVLAARLELATTSAERIGILQQTVENARKREEIAERLAEAGQGSHIARLKAKASRLRAEADLLRARLADKP